jgi:hypothetical protein
MKWWAAGLGVTFKLAVIVAIALYALGSVRR